MKTEEQRMEDFLIGLTKLTRDTDIVIEGCGCCGSPYFALSNDKEELADERSGYGYIDGQCQILWISPNTQWIWDEYSNCIARGKK